MPLTRINVPGHLDMAKVRALARGVQRALVQTCNVPPDDLFQLVVRLDTEQMILDPHFGGVERTADACVIEIMFLHGRTDDQKRALFRCIAQNSQAAGVRQDDVVVALSENSRCDWSLGRGLAYADLAKPQF